MCIAGCFAHFIGDDGLVDAPMSVTGVPNDQIVDIPVWITNTSFSFTMSPLKKKKLFLFVTDIFPYTGSFCVPRCSRCACRCGTSRWSGRGGPPLCISAPPLCLRSPPRQPEVWQSLASSSSPLHSPAPRAPREWMASSPAWPWRKERSTGLFYFCALESTSVSSSPGSLVWFQGL